MGEYVTMTTTEHRIEQESQQEPCDSATSNARIEGALPTRRPGQHPDTEEKQYIQAVFLVAFSEQANVSLACEQAGVDRSTVYRWLESDPEFAAGWEVAEQKADDVLRREAYRRGVIGYEEPIVSLGKLVYGTDGQPMTVRKYSDVLLLTLMRARMPEYKESKHVDMNSTVNVSTSTSHTLALDLRGMNAEELAQVRQIAQAMKEREQSH